MASPMKSKSILLTALLVCGVAHAESETKSEAPLPFEELRVFTEVFGKIKSEYVDPVDDASLLRDAIRGMLIGLDPHSSLLDAESFRDMWQSSEGRFNGLGLEITIEDGFIRVIAPIDDTPADRAGIQPGDLILMVDGVAVRNVDLREAAERLRGPPDSAVVLSISREGISDVFDIKLVRSVIEVAEVKGELLEDGYAYLRIANFQNATGGDVRKEIKKLKRKNRRRLNGLVLDMRNNPGGVLDAAVAVSDVFLDSGVIVSTRGRNADSDQIFHATDDHMLGNIPMVVLVNSGSASASEIVAGALQDHHRAIIMGARTFGKGSVQTVIPTSNGGALKLTTARYYTPSNRSIQARGIAPDIMVEARAPSTTEADAHEIREADLAGHLENDSQSADKDKNESDLAVRDYQVGEALKLLKGMSLARLREQSVTPAESAELDPTRLKSGGS